MASILDRFGIKEVCDLWFYEINDDGSKGKPVLYIDTAKTSTVEQTAEVTEAKGGKGNATLVSWDHSKEITVNVEDALFSAKSMAVIFGSGRVPDKNEDRLEKLAMATVNKDGKIDYFTADVYDSTSGSARKNIYLGEYEPKAGFSDAASLPNLVSYSNSLVTITGMYLEDGTQLYTTVDISGSTPIKTFSYVNPAFSPANENNPTDTEKENGSGFMVTGLKKADGSNIGSGVIGKKIFINYTVPVEKTEIQVTNDTFPGTYYVVGNTYCRSDVSGKDQFFQLVFPKAKMQAENTIELSADGDPAVAKMTLKLLRPADGIIMKLVQYDLDGNTGTVGSLDAPAS